MNVDELVAKLWMQYSRIVIVDGDTPSRVDMVNETGFKFAIREAILETRKAQWITVSERLPEDGQSAVVYVPGWEDLYLLNRIAWIDFDETPPQWISNGNLLDGVTHWMPLPEPPLSSPAASKPQDAGKGE
jgi:hypothetical protein